MRVLSDGRVRRTQAEWRELIARFEQSGLSMTAFCRRWKLPRSSFVKRRRQLGGSARGGRHARASAAFVEWIAPPSAQAPAVRGGGAGEFELSLPGGVVLRGGSRLAHAPSGGGEPLNLIIPGDQCSMRFPFDQHAVGGP
jgi:hypothetical protein